MQQTLPAPKATPAHQNSVQDSRSSFIFPPKRPHFSLSHHILSRPTPSYPSLSFQTTWTNSTGTHSAMKAMRTTTNSSPKPNISFDSVLAADTITLYRAASDANFCWPCFSIDLNFKPIRQKEENLVSKSSHLGHRAGQTIWSSGHLRRWSLGTISWTRKTRATAWTTRPTRCTTRPMGEAGRRGWSGTKAEIRDGKTSWTGSNGKTRPRGPPRRPKQVTQGMWKMNIFRPSGAQTSALRRCKSCGDGSRPITNESYKGKTS